MKLKKTATIILALFMQWNAMALMFAVSDEYTKFQGWDMVIMKAISVGFEESSSSESEAIVGKLRLVGETNSMYLVSIESSNILNDEEQTVIDGSESSKMETKTAVTESSFLIDTGADEEIIVDVAATSKGSVTEPVTKSIVISYL